MTTQVKVNVDDVILIATVGRKRIEDARERTLEDSISELLAEKRLSFRGWVPRYKDREAAIKELKKTDKYFYTSEYSQITRWLYRDSYDRLGTLEKMARSSIDDSILLGVEDHQLLARYAPEVANFVKENTDLTHTA